MGVKKDSTLKIQNKGLHQFEPKDSAPIKVETPKRHWLKAIEFKARVGNILNSYAEVKRGEQHSYLQKLVHGMPARLQKCKDNLYGRCGK